MTYFHRSAPESIPPPDLHPRLAIRTVEFPDSEGIVDGLMPCLPNGDLVVYDAMPYEPIAQGVSNVFLESGGTYVRPVTVPFNRWFE